MDGFVKFDDDIVFIDESGDHSLTSINSNYPIFVLMMVCFEKKHYSNFVIPAFTEFKFKYFGHDQIILHEHEIRKQEGDFAFLRTSHNLRESFFEDLNSLIEKCDFLISSTIIDKNNLTSKYKTPFNPYEIALKTCIDQLIQDLINMRSNGLEKLHFIFESRGKSEDKDLELEFMRIQYGEARLSKIKDLVSVFDIESRFTHKQANSIGLQIADLLARPIGLRYLRPYQKNRTNQIIESLYQNYTQIIPKVSKKQKDAGFSPAS